MTDDAELHAPALLVAMPQVADPFFKKSVVLLLQHEEAGSFGFILNRPTGVKLSDVLDGMEMVWGGQEEAEAFIGGPVQPQLGSVLFDTRTDEEEQAVASTEVLPGLSMSQHVGDLEKLIQVPPEHMRLFLGYAAWGAGQLVDEILRNDWLVAPVDGSLVFTGAPDGSWDAALRSLGIENPGVLPTWTADDSETAN